MDKIRLKSEHNLSLHEKAIRLCEGGVVDIDGHAVRAVECPHVENPCMVCEMDSACRMDMTDLCGECEAITQKRYYLKFAYTIKN